MPIFDVSGTLLILGAFCANAVAFSLLLQPVAWHAKKISAMDELRAEAIKVCRALIFNKYCGQFFRFSLLFFALNIKYF